MSVTRSVREKMAAIGMQAPILVTTVPNAADYLDNFGAIRKVYYCVDDFSLWPGLEHELVREMENRLISGCEVFIATSQQLVEKLRSKGKIATLLTHGVDLEHFSNLPSREHQLLEGTPKPRVGYFGLIDERLDQKLLSEVAGALPDVAFVMTGNVVTDVTLLKGRKNIHWTGPVPYEELPAMVAGWQACMLPYRVNETTATINPLKLKEYIATGKPLVISALPEVNNFVKMLRPAISAAEWTTQIHFAVTDNQLTTEMLLKRRKYLLGESWSIKADMFLSYAEGKG